MTTPYQIAFSGGPFDHAETKRDSKTLQALIDGDAARSLVFHHGKPAMGPDGALVQIHPKTLIGKNMFDPGPVYLGQDGDTPLFCAGLVDEPDFIDGQCLDMRMAAGSMSPKDLAIAGRARALLDWHFNNGYCPKCATKTDARDGGIKRVCTACKVEHFPRVNPVVIMMVLHGDHCLLGRGLNWPDGAYSTLAGFVSPGETIEEACKREVWEETGVMTTNHRYLMSQPWPFPAQLMLGMVCDAQDKELTVNKAELENAQWFSKDTVKGVFAKTDESFRRPPSVAIAHQLLRWWISDDQA